MTHQQQVEQLLDQQTQAYLRLGTRAWWQARGLALVAVHEAGSWCQEPGAAKDFLHEAVLAIEAMQLHLAAGAV
jgi:hypothetical protein